METIRLAEIPVEILWEYTETKQNKTATLGTTIGIINTREVYGLPSATDNHSSPLQLSIVGTTALLIDGSSQIKAAMQSGRKHVLVNVSVFLGDGKKVFFNSLLNRFKPINNDLALCLKKIFL